MTPKDHIKIDLPLPWSNCPMRMHARGVVAVIGGVMIVFAVLAAVVALLR